MIDRVAHFTILAKLGQGGMGIVFKAQDTKLRRLVALKLLPPEHGGDADRRARFMREARAAAAVTHPNIATIYEIGEDEAGRIFIAMELVEGISLREHLATRGRLSVAETLTIARSVARGLAKAHDIGLVHRDLKPDNLMLTPEGDVKILDFGLAKARELTTPSVLAAAVTGEMDAPAITEAGVIVGTPGYMSPEQTTGAHVDARSDLFAVGVVVFEILTGKLPFRGSTVGELLVAAARDQPRSLAELAPDVPPALAALVERCLSKNAEDRPSTARDVADAIDGIEHGRSDVAFAHTERVAATDPPPPAAVTAQRPSRRRHLRLIAAATSLLTVAAVCVLLCLRSSPPAAIASADASADAGVGLLDLPIPAHCNDAARGIYRAALEASRGRGMELGREEFARAAEADPNCAEAHLRAAIHEPGGTGAAEHYKRAALLRDQLSERDRALLDVHAPFFASDPPNYGEAERRLLVLSRSRPRDAELLVLVGYYLWVKDPAGELPSIAQRAIDIDPGFATAWQLLGIARMKAGDEEGARQAFDRCEQTIPTAVDCVLEAARHAQWTGRCEDMEAHARTLTARLPADDKDGYLLVANALASTGAGREATAVALRQYTSTVPPDHAYVVKLEEARLAIAYGDFEHADGLLAAVEQALEGSHQLSRHAECTQLRFELDLETDRTDAALVVAEQFARRQRAWSGSVDEAYGTYQEGFLLVPRMLGLQAKTGKITAARHDAEIATWIARTETLGDVRVRWIAQSAAWVETRDEAERALGTMPSPDASSTSISPLRGLPSALYGHVLALGGRTTEGIAELRRVTSRCERLDDPIAQTQAYLWLGEALEPTGATADACAAYAVVRARWGEARPPSRSAKHAGERMKALDCAP